eukprot:Colp12_sorted_trinity150504_noHs@21457
MRLASVALWALFVGTALAVVCNDSGNRRDCGYFGIQQNECESKGCCWRPSNDGSPWCFYGQQAPASSGYTVAAVNTTSNGFTALLNANSNAPRLYGDDVKQVLLSVFYEENDRLHFKFTDPARQRWEVPTKYSARPDLPAAKAKSPMYDFVIPAVGQAFSFKVVRTADKEVIFDAAGVIFEDQFLSVTTSLPQNPNIYGLGEHKHPLRLNSDDHFFTMWAFDTPTPVDLNLYGSHPFYIDQRVSGKAHGVFLRNSNAMDVQLGKNYLSFKVIGGILDFYVFMGPTPGDVVKQYLSVIGRPAMPPYWGLGWHQCRYGYKNLTELKNVVAGYKKASIPLETMWTDIDYMDQYEDFTWDPTNFPEAGMRQFVEDLHANDQHYVVIVDPGIKNVEGYAPYDDGLKKDLFIKDPSGKPTVGRVWPGFTVFPDWLHPEADAWWETHIQTWLKGVPVDGLWIDMNEASNFCNGDCFPRASNPTSVTGFNPENPPYKIHNQGNQNTALNTKALPTDALHYGGVLEYDVHNLFGTMEARATYLALSKEGKRPFIISRSTFPGSGVHTGHWTGDNTATWDDLYYSIPGMLNFNMFGIPLVGSDICGFIDDTTEELCQRWTLLGAFYPFSRNHNVINAKPQEPYTWESVAKISREVLATKYSLLPYYYTLFFDAHTQGSTVVRPLFFEFPADPMTFPIDRQFLVGSGLLISPVVTQNTYKVNAYFPEGQWYDFYTGQLTASNLRQYKTLDTPFDKIQVHVRGGTILPMQQPALTTTAARRNPYMLKIALTSQGAAAGRVYLDDGITIDTPVYTLVEYTVSSNKLAATVVSNKYNPGAPLNDVTVFGVNNKPASVQVNGQALPASQVSYNSNTKTLSLSGLQLSMQKAFDIVWA